MRGPAWRCSWRPGSAAGGAAFGGPGALPGSELRAHAWGGAGRRAGRQVVVELGVVTGGPGEGGIGDHEVRPRREARDFVGSIVRSAALGDEGTGGVVDQDP